MTSLDTKLTRDGIELADSSGKVRYLITYQHNPNIYQVTVNEKSIGKGWITREAAEFYALALESERLEALRLNN